MNIQRKPKGMEILRNSEINLIESGKTPASNTTYLTAYVYIYLLSKLSNPVGERYAKFLVNKTYNSELSDSKRLQNQLKYINMPLMVPRIMSLSLGLTNYSKMLPQRLSTLVAIPGVLLFYTGLAGAVNTSLNMKLHKSNK